MESCRLWFWENRLKLLQIVTLVYAFLLSLLEKELRQAVSNLLRQGCHRTGKRCRNTPTPLYRIRLALANLWNLLFLALSQTPGGNMFVLCIFPNYSLVKQLSARTNL